MGIIQANDIVKMKHQNIKLISQGAIKEVSVQISRTTNPIFLTLQNLVGYGTKRGGVAQPRS